MRGYIQINIPVKSYVRAYIQHHLNSPYIKLATGGRSAITSKLYDLLAHSTNESASHLKADYPDEIACYISIRTFEVRGHNLNSTNIVAFNNFCEELIKDKFYFMMDFLVTINHNFTNNLNYVRTELGIDIESWSDDSMKKAYYRYRKRNGKPLLYNSTEKITPPFIFLT